MENNEARRASKSICLVLWRGHARAHAPTIMHVSAHSIVPFDEWYSMQESLLTAATFNREPPKNAYQHLFNIMAYMHICFNWIWKQQLELYRCLRDTCKMSSPMPVSKTEWVWSVALQNELNRITREERERESRKWKTSCMKQKSTPRSLYTMNNMPMPCCLKELEEDRDGETTHTSVPCPLHAQLCFNVVCLGRV